MEKKVTEEDSFDEQKNDDLTLNQEEQEQPLTKKQILKSFINNHW